jgi:D-beta-D-heptose 7-phosphate kinase/D-beta-D-heptose 1-phosphate adenosyltransferase
MKIVVIGELCHDYFIYGESKRLSPEAPVPVFVPLRETTNLGMAGNVRQNLWAINQNLQVGLYHQLRTIKKTRYVDEKTNHMFLRVDEGESNIDGLYLSDEIIHDMKLSDATIISDYDKGFLSHTMIRNILNFPKFKVIDTKKILDESIIEKLDFIKLNESEYKSNNIPEKFLNKVIVTLGSKGAMYMDTIYPSPSPKETIDVSGAGDTFTASFTLKYLETKNVEDSIIYANQMSSIVVSKKGVATI